MKTIMQWMMGLSVVCLTMSASADTLHVWTNSPANGPGTASSNAFHTIQSARDSHHQRGECSNAIFTIKQGLFN